MELGSLGSSSSFSPPQISPEYIWTRLVSPEDYQAKIDECNSRPSWVSLEYNQTRPRSQLNERDRRPRSIRPKPISPLIEDMCSRSIGSRLGYQSHPSYTQVSKEPVEPEDYLYNGELLPHANIVPFS